MEYKAIKKLVLVSLGVLIFAGLVWAVQSIEYKIGEKKCNYDEDESMCLSALAIKFKDPTPCMNLDNVKNKDRCLSWVAEEKKDPKLCEFIQNETVKDSCFYFQAYEKEDLKLCDSIFSDQNKSDCYADLGVLVGSKRKNILACSDYSVSYQDGCYTGVAQATSNPESCRRITDLEIKTYCFLTLAKKNRDPLICEGIENIENARVCSIIASQ